jgi:hypothetical protein
MNTLINSYLLTDLLLTEPVVMSISVSAVWMSYSNN